MLNIRELITHLEVVLGVEWSAVCIEEGYHLCADDYLDALIIRYDNLSSKLQREAINKAIEDIKMEEI